MNEDRQTELLRRERRAEEGQMQMAEELKAIRDLRLYPGAPEIGHQGGHNGGGEEDAWEAYCRDRWGMSQNTANGLIQAIDVVQRRLSATDSVGDRNPLPGGASAAARIASLPYPVQDAILDGSTLRVEVSARATAVRKEARRVEQTEHRSLTDQEMIEVAMGIDWPPKKKKKRKEPEHIALIRDLSEASFFVERAAEYVQRNDLDDWANDWTVDRMERLDYQLQRIKDTLRASTTQKDWDEEAAKLLGGAS